MDMNSQCVIRSTRTCRSTTSSGGCSVCQTDYVLIGSICYYARNNVAQFSSDGSQIQQVAQGYFLWAANNIAWRLDSNCEMQNAPGMCLRCASGFSLSSGSCLFRTDNCRSYNFNGYCQKCRQGFSLQSLRCRELQCPNTWNLVIGGQPTCTFC